MISNLISVRDCVREFSTAWPSEQSLYASIREGVIPKGIVIAIGRKKLINRQRLIEWFDAGGSELAGGWRREAR